MLGASKLCGQWLRIKEKDCFGIAGKTTYFIRKIAYFIERVVFCVAIGSFLVFQTSQKLT